MNQSERMSAVQSPVIPIVAEMIRAHPGTISLGQGVVHWGPPKAAMDAIPRFAADGENHKYRPVHGIPELCDALWAKLRADNHIPKNDEHRLVVTAGGNMAFNNAVLAISSPGDQIVILSPYYFNHEMAIAMAGCHSVVVETDASFKPNVGAIAGAITRKTRAVVTVSPNNPTGAVYSEQLLRELNTLCRDSEIYHIHDEAYEYFTWDAAKHYSPASDSESRSHTISLFSLSKSYGFASWRIGYMLIPEHLFEAVRKIQDTILICPPVISQFAAVGALSEGSAYCRANVKEMEKVRTLVGTELAKLRGLVSVAPAEGAFYFFLKVHSDMDAMKLVQRLIREHGVAAIPGSTFGMERGCHLRIAYAALEAKTVAEGMGRLVRGIRKIAGGAT
jgi:aspartate/methionine/tyrosine aminotransferase